MKWQALLLVGSFGLFGPAALAADAPTGRPALKAAPAPGWVLCRKGSAEPPSQTFPEVPSGDIFGFTNPTDLGSPGDCGISVESSSAIGKASGRYFAGSLKTQFDATVAENLNLAVSPFVTYHRITGVPGLDDLHRASFDGLSAELAYRFIERSAANPVAATFAVEPRWARVDPTTGLGATAYLVEFKLLVDRVIVPDRLYAAANLIYVPAVQKSNAPLGGWSAFSATGVSAAFAYQFTERLFAGAEVRHFAAFEGAAVQHYLAQAVFGGPTMLVKLTDAMSLNVSWTPQLWGHPSGSHRRLELDIFERQQLRLKLVTNF
jgi:hypothetical protein